MKRWIAALALAGLSFGAEVQPAAAQSYPIDCAILLCLAGGWPASVPCARARAEFIRRITPWPVEPPLQIWRCPMHAALRLPEPQESPYLLRDASFAARAAPQSLPADVKVRGLPSRETPAPAVFRSAGAEADLWRPFLQLAQAIGSGADIDISGREFDFVRSIDVWHVRYSALLVGSSKSCMISDRTDQGSYGLQGDFRWARRSARSSPLWIRPKYDCNHPGAMRAVGVSWTDSFGQSGHEVVYY